MPFGFIDTQYVDLPSGLDEGYLRGLQTRSGLSVAQMIQEVDSAMDAINAGASPLVADLVSFTDDPVAGGRGTSTKKVMRAGEYTMGRPQRSARTGHMLPLEKYEMVIGFTEDGLEEISLEAFRQELSDMVAGYERFYLAQTLYRLFAAGEVAVDQGTAVLSPGFAGSGTGANVFGGVYPDGSVIAGGYTHYGYTAPASLATTIDTFVARLERWHTPPFDLIASPAMMDHVVALSGFVTAGSALVRPAMGTAEALVDATNYLGVLNGKIRVRHEIEGIGASKHLAIFKSYGAFDSRNPLSWRYDPMKGREAFVRSRALYPLAEATALQWLGIGVGDRVGAAVIFADTAPGAYVDPTITIV
jgi:hypothetical protein